MFTLSAKLQATCVIIWLILITHCVKQLRWIILCVQLLSPVQLCDPLHCGPPGSFVLGFSRQENWSGLPFILVTYRIKQHTWITLFHFLLTHKVKKNSIIPAIQIKLEHRERLS